MKSWPHRLVLLGSALLLGSCVKAGFPSLMCQYRSGWAAADQFSAYAAKDSAAYRAASDKFGNVYVIGYGTDLSDQAHWIVRKSADRGETWSTVENLQLNSGFDTIGLGILAQSSGTVFAVGYAYDATSFSWLVRKSTDGGATWTTAEAFQKSPAKGATANSIAQDPSGNLYVVGAAADSTNVFHWLVRKSTDGGETWSDADDFNQVSGQDASAEGITIDPAGAIYVNGYSYTDSFLPRWTIRKSTDGGSTWTTIDAYAQDSTMYSVATGVAVDNEGRLVASGYSDTATAHPQWIVRKSTDGGTTWATAEELSLSSGQASEANSVVRDPFGAFYVMGSAQDGSGNRHLIIRKSADGGTTWTTAYDYQLASGADTSGYRLSADPDGNLYANGRGKASPSASYEWLTHRLKCE
jgi:hypothetical protein